MQLRYTACFSLLRTYFTQTTKQCRLCNVLPIVQRKKNRDRQLACSANNTPPYSFVLCNEQVYRLLLLTRSAPFQ